MTDETPTKRNPLAVGLRFRPGAGVHEKTNKAKRLKNKRLLDKEVKEQQKEPSFD